MPIHRPPLVRALPIWLAALALAACTSGSGAGSGQTTPATTAPASAAVPPARATQVTTVEGITEYQLGNGMRVLLFSDPTRPTTTVNVTYFVGSRHEGYGETGMAHLLEHLVFKGTPSHPNITEEMSRRGGRANGTTWVDRTNYFQTFPATDENLEWSLTMEADRMINSFISADDLSSEMTVVRNEWESGENSPSGVLFKRTMAAAFQWHGYGRSTIGERSDIENVPIERLQAFYRKYYQPDNAILVVSGKFDEERTLRLVERTFGAIPRPERAGDMRLFETYTREPTQDGERTVTLRRVGDVQLAVAIYRVPAASHPDYPSVTMLSHILGDAPRGRLHRALVEPGKAARVSTYTFPWREPGVLAALVEVRTEQSLDEARRILLQTIEGLADRPPTAEEIERARTALLRDLRLTLNNSDQVGVGLSEWAAAGDWRLIFIHRDRLRETSAEEVARAARSYLLSSNRTIGTFIPEREPRRAQIPEAPAIDTLVADYRGDQVESVVEEFDASIEAIEQRVVRSELPGGARVALLPKKTRGGAVVATITLRLGSEKTLLGRRLDGEMAAAMLMRGTRRLNRQQLADEFDRLQARVSVSGGPTQVSARIETVGEHLDDVIALVAEVLREPAFDAREFEELRRERLASIENQISEPQAQAVLAFGRHLNQFPPRHPHYTPTFEEALAATKKVRLADVRRFHKEFFGAGPATTIAAVGDFEVAAVNGALAARLGGWTASRPFERIPTPFRDAAATTISIETPDKSNAMILAGHNVAMRDDHPDYAAMVLGNFILGGGFLSSRLSDRIRQRDGLSYGVGSSFSASPLDESGGFVFYAIFAPENAARVEAAFREELARALDKGFTAEELQAAKLGWSQSRQVSRGTDRELVATLASGLYLERTLEHDAKLEARVAALTSKEIVEALRRHIAADRLALVRAGDFAKGKSEE